MGKIEIAVLVVGAAAWWWSRRRPGGGKPEVEASVAPELTSNAGGEALDFPISMQFLKENRLCFNCFGKGHPSAVCRNRSFPRCMNCGKFGHKAFKCYSKAQA